MLAGPVFHFELVRIARRRRFYLMRFLFGLILLGLIGFNYLGVSGPWRYWIRPASAELSIKELADFGQAIFVSLTAAQGVFVIGLTPALVADAIASERQRKTLHYLLSSPLRSGEIVAGKLAARLVYVAVYMSVAMPISALLTLFGGVVPEGMFLAYVATLSTAYFLAGLAVLASVMARRPRDAVGAAYALTAFWLCIPSLIDALPIVPTGWGAGALMVVRAVVEWIWPARPFWLMGNIFGGGLDQLWRQVAWMVASQIAYGTLFVALAAWRLRPAFRRHEGRAGRLPSSSFWARRWRWFRRPSCGDDPILWKETYAARSGGGVVRQLIRLAILLLSAGIVVSVLYWSWGAFSEVLQNGYGFDDSRQYQGRMAFNLALRFGGTALLALWLLWLASVTAASFSTEREQDTWISLLATPLEGREIVRGKMLGALRSTGLFGVVIVALWILGVAAGAVHPLGFLLAMAGLALFTWFVTALGTFISLRSKTTWRAQAWTLGIVIAPHVCCMLPIPSILLVMGFSLCSYAEIHGLLQIRWAWSDYSWIALLYVAYFVVGIVVYALAAFFLTRSALSGFDRVADRPRRSYWRHPRRVGVEDGSGAKPVKDEVGEV